MMLRCRVICATQRGKGLPLRTPPRPSDFHQRIATQFDKRAEMYDVGNTYHPPLAAKLVEMAALGPGEKVLDVAAGTGLVALLAAELVGQDGQVTAVDLSEAMIQKAMLKAEAAGLRNATFLTADVDQCSFAAGSFDAILCSSALPFLPDIPASLAQWHSWLRPGGRVAFNVPKGVGSQAYTIFADLAAEQGLLLVDPCAQFAAEQAVQGLLLGAGYSACRLCTTNETNFRAGRTAEAWAVAGWDMCVGMPFADLPALLSKEELEEMRGRYLQVAAQLATKFEVPEGILEPYAMLWVVAQR